MDTVLQTLLSWQFVLFCLALAAMVFVLRKIAEYAMANWAAAKDSKLWKDLLLPILPIVLGPVAAFFAKRYPYPENLQSPSGRMAFGLVAGLLSGLVYRIIKSVLASKLPALLNKLPGAAVPPVEPTEPAAPPPEDTTKE